ncbi:hypothetical protein A0J61_05473 [Choanephora cucurbitarum]|uniref:Uncharacterized protein n=1 Tax=Choanephora cucurbitarum TaxID=101091 RepID=A0A1C7NBJ4_9FUNG|nr:hypothetical protein A0J61_05473 [Choanephora cucurbitarum]
MQLAGIGMRSIEFVLFGNNSNVHCIGKSTLNKAWDDNKRDTGFYLTMVPPRTSDAVGETQNLILENKIAPVRQWL